MTTPIEKKQSEVEKTLRLAPVVAVVVIEDLAAAVPLAKALVAGGIPAIEITLRTPVALDAIRAIASEVEGAVVGSGTVLTSNDLKASERAGARFAVSPGATRNLLDAADASLLPWLPAAATASEAMALFERGYRFQKFFPAVPAGGVNLLKAWASPLPGITFCPTGGIRENTAPDFLASPNVVCVGGTWLSPSNLLQAGDWNKIEQLARLAAALKAAT
ncbi:MAG: bifunctional 4-hydroxy-2-oxoglutarate aldolase/2-dehydro-3-deoxy-phosphogluconate aldolase [Proteobacteria bacterium]|uniref:bifunctional 4-hydroxy-2-oxoglutarate aldolase/2-dehydro-3-deoxy-phosphogluconate aldolase n=1 Tax=Rudaea sp. TaxID=2136325 RepID=UPI001DC76750|nr:bifunctional 4-hydroxy-2-oxoglutarate aldolase/2-dehydro-3-deoxy-phosphogluconate aldolase [Pseudomonadota bacterium]MBS0566405.1 bifunctional 4-hydroxy-2-oxoglutarate aldolase/2-dehydro-3-deoxy-phosphogluconate aldolase [Pseudomonadota bacterium]